MEENRLSTIESYQKIARCVSNEKLSFRDEFSLNISFIERTFKSKVYVLPSMSNLFGKD